MSIPALRRPKPVEKNNNTTELKKNAKLVSENNFMILTLKNGKKLVVDSDSFHGIISYGDLYNCVLCNEINITQEGKEIHKVTDEHKKYLGLYPHNEKFDENLIRQLDNDTCYCTICNIQTSTRMLTSHLTAESHVAELKKATVRSLAYKPLI